MLIGRQRYDGFAPVWPKMDQFAEDNTMPKHVVLTTLSDPEWNNTTVLRSLDEVAEPKAGEGGSILVHGSGTLVRGLLAAGLVDRFHLLVFTVVLGSGKRLFDHSVGEKSRLRLTEHESYSDGVVKAVYDVVR